MEIDFQSEFLKISSPELARFNGMSIRMFYDDHTLPHIHVKTGTGSFRLRLPDLVPLEGKVPSAVVGDLREWFKIPVPSQQPNRIFTSVVVGELVWEQWWNARNRALIRRIPTPDEIKAMKKTGSKLSSFHQRSLIKDVRVLRPCIVLVDFADGSRKRVDIRSMRGHIPPFDRTLDSPKEFATVRFEPETLLWGRGIDQLEIESEDLYAAGRAVAP
jgi:hypothetical protein